MTSKMYKSVSDIHSQEGRRYAGKRSDRRKVLMRLWERVIKRHVRPDQDVTVKGDSLEKRWKEMTMVQQGGRSGDSVGKFAKKGKTLEFWPEAVGGEMED